jgi:hypothetical protein
MARASPAKAKTPNRQARELASLAEFAQNGEKWEPASGGRSTRRSRSSSPYSATPAGKGKTPKAAAVKKSAPKKLMDVKIMGALLALGLAAVGAVFYSTM